MSDQYYPVRKMFFKTYVGNSLKYCISWLNWDPKDLAMVTEDALINYSRCDLDNIKLWRDYKREINYKSTFATYAKEKKINLTCTYLNIEKIGTVSGISGIPSTEGSSTEDSGSSTGKRKYYGGEEPVVKKSKISNLEEPVISDDAEEPVCSTEGSSTVIPRKNNSFIRVVNMVIMTFAFILHFIMLYINFSR
jgi:hypothetical protein